MKNNDNEIKITDEELLINAHKLEIGKQYGYKQLCEEILKDAYYQTGGDVKKNQLVNWDRFFKWQHIGRKYKITAILDEPEPKQVKNSNEKYYSLIWFMILELNRRFKEDCVVDFRVYLMQMFGFFSDAFCDEKRKRKLSDEAVRFITNPLNRSFDGVMNSLSKKGIIAYGKYYEAKDLQSKVVYELTGNEFERYKEIKAEAIKSYFDRYNKDIPKKNPIGIIVITGGWIEYSKLVSDAVKRELNIRVFEKYKYQLLDTKLTYNQSIIDPILEQYEFYIAEDKYVDPLDAIAKEINRRANDAIREKLNNIDELLKLQNIDKSCIEIQELLTLNLFTDDIITDLTAEDNCTPTEDFANKRFYNHELLYNKQDPEDEDTCYIEPEDIEDIQTDEYNTIAEDITADEPAYTPTDDPWFNECQEYVDMFEPQETIEPVQTEDIHETEKINDCFNDLFDDALDKAEEALEEFTIQDYIDNNIAIPQHLQKEYERYLDEQKRKWKRQYKNTLQTSLMIEPETNTDTDNITELNGNNSSLNEFEYKGEKLSLTDEELVKWFEGNDDYFEHLRHKDICKLYKEARFRLNNYDPDNV